MIPPDTVKQTEHEWLYAFADVNPRTGKSCAILALMMNTSYMNKHLLTISR